MILKKLILQRNQSYQPVCNSMAEPLRSDRLGRYVTHYDGNDYISCCTCVRSGRKSECRCGEDQEELDWTWDLSSTNSDTKLQVGTNADQTHT